MLILRRAVQGDVQEIAQIAAAGWRHTYRGLISPEAIEDTLERWWVYAIYVEPAMLGEGIGWALWQQVKREAKAAGRSVWVLEGNRLGIDWYNRQGESTVGQREVELLDGTHTELHYRFDLTTD